MKRALVLLLVASSCNKKSSEPAPAPVPAPPAATASFVTDEAKQLPGTLYFLHGDALARLAGGAASTDFDDAGATVFPSRHALPDGRLVGIASKGDGSAGGEQLVLIGPGKAITRVGPAATQIRSPAVDPRGAWIVVEGRFTPSPSLYRIDLATQEHAQLTSTDKGDFTPALLGTDAIVFASSRDGDSEIYRVDAFAKQPPQRLTAFHRDDFDPIASPDGKLVAFVSDREGRPRIFLMNADGTQLRRLSTRTSADGVDEEQPVFSPDGSQLAYLLTNNAVSQLVIHDLATATSTVLSPVKVRDEHPSFSPDGAWLVVQRTALDGSRSEPQLWAVARASRAWIQITRGPTAHRIARWR